MTIVTKALDSPTGSNDLQDTNNTERIVETNTESNNVGQNIQFEEIDQSSNVVADQLNLLENVNNMSPNASDFTGDECDSVVLNTAVSFPYSSLVLLEEKLANSRWVIPIMPEQELEIILNAALELCRTGDDVHSEPCQRFFNKSLGICIERMVSDDSIPNSKTNVCQSILSHCLRIIEMCVLKLPEDDLQFLEHLAVILNPSTKFNSAVATRLSDSIPLGSSYPDDYLYARPYPDHRNPRGWLVDMVNKFGDLDGFELMLKRFESEENLTVQIAFALLRPFGSCCDLLTPFTIDTYFIPIVDTIPGILEKLTDDELKKEAKNDLKNDNVSTLIKICCRMVSRVPNHEEKQKEFEMLRLKMLLRMLQISSFNGKMNALTEINKLINDMNFFGQKHSNYDSEDWITPDLLAQWIKKNRVLKIVLGDSLHQPQYVEKLERILRFVIKEHALTIEDLDALWAAQSGKHEAIVKNVHDLLSKLAWDFSPEQLDYLFSCFQASWSSANQKQSEKLLELIRKLAEDDKIGVMAKKVLTLFWNLCHNEDVVPEILDQALVTHVKILDYDCSQDKNAQKIVWIDKCVSEVKGNSNWVVPALKLIKQICSLYENNCHTHQRGQLCYRREIIEKLEQQYSFICLVTENLVSYINSVKKLLKAHRDLNLLTYYPDKRYNHGQQVHERLSFLRFLLKDGQLRLGYSEAKLIWESLAENATCVSDREACFKWFSKIANEQMNVDVSSYRKFFENHILQFDPSLITEIGLICFERFFKLVNCKEEHYRRNIYDCMNNFELIGTDYLWRIVTNSGDRIAGRAIELLKEVYTSLGVRMTPSLRDFHDTQIFECIGRLRVLYDTITVLCSRDENDCGDVSSNSDNNVEKTEENLLIKSQIRNECTKMIRILKVLNQYIYECDSNYRCRREYLPLYRAFRGRDMHFILKMTVPNRQVEEEELFSHSNETVEMLKRNIAKKLKPPYNSETKIEVYSNGDHVSTLYNERAVHEIMNSKIVQVAVISERHSNSSSDEDSIPEIDSIITNHGENLLPGVMISRNSNIIQFCFQIADKGIELGNDELRECARMILKVAPPDESTINKLNILFNAVKPDEVTIDNGELPTVENMFFCSSSSQVLYNLEVLYTMLMPCIEPMTFKELNFQCAFIKSQHVTCCFDMLNNDKFLANSDMPTKRQAYITVLKICKLVLYTMAYYFNRYMDVSPKHSPDVPFFTENTKKITQALKQMMYSMSRHHPEYSVCTIGSKITDRFVERLRTNNHSSQPSILREHNWNYPDIKTIKSIIKLSWSSNNQIHGSLLTNYPILDDVLLCKEALEVLTLSLGIHFSALETLCTDPDWLAFIVDIVLTCPNCSVRSCGSEQFNTIFTNPLNFNALMSCISGMFNTLNTDIINSNASNSQEYCQLLCHLLNYIHSCDSSIPNADAVLKAEVLWIYNLRNQVKTAGEVVINDVLLEGHLSVTRELFSVTDVETKCYYGAHASLNINLVKILIEDFILPASNILARITQDEDLLAERIESICRTSSSLDSSFEILVMLCKDCVPNLKILTDMITDLFYSGRDEPILEWDYYPPIGPRPINGFVGLKNASATCYMNSVLQQLCMIESIRVNVLAAEGAVDDDEDVEDDKEIEVKVSLEESRQDYNVNILKQVQTIFGYLTYSKLQYYVPRGLWRHFRLQGEPVNLREQQDAVEFFMNLIECIDEALKTLNNEQIMSKILGGTYSDQKVCKECPHRYCKEEPFSVLSVDIRNHCNLLYSLEQYVKGELLEGADAYHCDKCNKKVVTVKRLCVKKLPPVLTIQLKRFEYDYERGGAIKYNDYFEFPRYLDMEPYTVYGLAKAEGELIDCDDEVSGNVAEDETSATSVNVDVSNVSSTSSSIDNNDGNRECKELPTKYTLTGIIVHNGQATGGHYYSYIMCRLANGAKRWFKFDDGLVSEWRMDDDEEMRMQCFGGEYANERFNFRKQKRWWNAYMLFYTRIDLEENSLLSEFKKHSIGELKMPKAIEISIKRQNLKFMHLRSQFSVEYFHFMKRIGVCNNASLGPSTDSERSDEEMSLLTTQLISRFLFTTGFRTKKSLRTSAPDWLESLLYHLRLFRSVRLWFVSNMLLEPPNRYCEYMVICNNLDIRNMFSKMVAHLAHLMLADEKTETELLLPNDVHSPTITISDQLLLRALELLNKDLGDYGRQVYSVSTLFHLYMHLGKAERMQMLKLNIPAVFMLLVTNETPGPSMKFQSVDFSKCHSVIATLVRCYNITTKYLPAMPITSEDYYRLKMDEYEDEKQETQMLDELGNYIRHNPYGEYRHGEELMIMQPELVDLLYTQSIYIKKVIEESQVTDDVIKMFQYICWENAIMSKKILTELLAFMSVGHISEVKCVTDIIACLLRIEDSWQAPRVFNTLNGMDCDKEGIFDIFLHHKLYQPKRAYYCVKILVLICTRSRSAYNLLLSQTELKNNAWHSIQWLKEQMILNKTYVGSPEYNNCTNNTFTSMASSQTDYPLERSNSAKKILEKGLEIFPESDLPEVPFTVQHIRRDDYCSDDACECEILQNENLSDHRGRLNYNYSHRYFDEVVQDCEQYSPPPRLEPYRSYYGSHHSFRQLPMQHSLDLSQSVIEFNRIDNGNFAELTKTAAVPLDDIILPVEVNDNEDTVEDNSPQKAADSSYDL